MDTARSARFASPWLLIALLVHAAGCGDSGGAIAGAVIDDTQVADDVQAPPPDADAEDDTGADADAADTAPQVDAADAADSDAQGEDAAPDVVAADVADAAADVTAADAPDAAPGEDADAALDVPELPDAQTAADALAPDDVTATDDVVADDAAPDDAAPADDAEADAALDVADDVPEVDAGCASAADCPAPGDACKIAVCNPDGSCGTGFADDGSACDDGQICTGPDGCALGLCVGAPITCDDGNVCTVELCFPVGGCVWLPTGGTCSDGDACTTGEACSAKACGGGTALTCDDDNPCTDDACAKDVGCTHTPNAASCSDGTPCTTGDHCEGGVCASTGTVSCDDGQVCTTDACNTAGACTHVANALPCDDGSACTSGDACGNEACAGVQIACTDGWPCTADSCDPATGCVFTPDSSQCDDSNVCTSDVCTGAHGCVHSAIDGPCTDGDSCTVNDACANSNCKPGSAMNCDDQNVCTSEYCDSAQGGCVFQTLSITCNDGLACTINDTCVGKVCKGITANCDDGNVCTNDACDGTAACAHTAILGGICDDGNPCTTDTCDAMTAACGHIVLNSGPCEDGNGCTTNETCVVGVCVAALSASVVSTVSGSGAAGSQDGPGTSASFSNPYGMVPAGDGSMLVGEWDVGRIRRVKADGTVSTVAGTGTAGSANGPVASATFYRPGGMAVSPSGDIYVAEYGNNLIRKISGGYVTTFAGSTAGFKDGIGSAAQFSGPSDIKFDSKGMLWVTDQENHRIRRIAPDGAVATVAGTGTAGYLDGAAASAKFSEPSALAIASDGSVFIVDGANYRIRKLAADGSTVSTFSGAGYGYLDGAGSSAKYGWLSGLVFVGNTLVTSDAGNRIRAIAPDGSVSTVAGSGTAGYIDGAPSSAAFNLPRGVAVDFGGSVWIADETNQRIRKLTFSFPTCNDGNVCTADTCASGTCAFAKLASGSACDDGSACTTGDTCTSGSACVGTPQSCDDSNACTTDFCNPLTLGCSHIAVANWSSCDDGSVCTAKDTCFYGKCIASPVGTVSTLAGSGTAGFVDGAPTSAQFNGPRGATATLDGGVLIADTYNSRIRKIDASGNVSTWAGSGTAGDQDGPVSSAQFREPHHMVIGPDGTTYVTEWLGHRIRAISPGGNVTTLAGSTTAQSGFVNSAGTTARFFSTTGIVFAANGDLLVADNNNHAIRRVTLGGAVSTFAGGNGAGGTDGTALSAKFANPTGLALDPAGNVYVAESSGNRIRRIGPDGTVSTVLGDGTAGFSELPGIAAKLNGPWDILWHPAGFAIFSDTPGGRVRALWPDGTNATIAGNGNQGYVDGSGLGASFSYGEGLALLPSGAFVVVDGSGNRVRKVTLNAVTCNDNNPCTADSCDPTSGACVFTPATSGGGSCDDGNACTTDGCNADTGACGHTVVADGSVPCSDNNLCTTGESCVGGKCGGSAPVSCDDSNPCTTDTCGATTGCGHGNLAVGTSCGANGMICDANGVCQSTVCGNNLCESGEQCNVCVADCGQCGPWTFGGMTGFNHSVGQQWGGDTWGCEGSGCNDFIGWGPYTKVIGPGPHTAIWTMIIDGTYASSTVAAGIDVNDSTHGKILASMNITFGQAAPLGNWRTYTLNFTVPQGASLEFRTWDTGNWGYFFDWQKVVLGRVDVY